MVDRKQSTRPALRSVHLRVLTQEKNGDDNVRAV